MKHLVRSLFGVVAIAALLALHAAGEPVSADRASALAGAFLATERCLTPARLETGFRELSDPIAIRDRETDQLLGFVLELEPQGFVVVSTDTELVPVVAFSLDSEFPWDDDPDNILLDMLLGDMANRLALLEAGCYSPSEANENERLWRAYAFGEGEPLLADGTWGPLLETGWNQSYNQGCPSSAGCGWSRCAAGCVATAMAQVINYWEYPKSVTFTAGDSYSTCARGLYVDATQASIDSIDYPLASFSAISELMFAAGVSVDMDYCTSGCASGALLSATSYALKGGGWSWWCPGYTYFPDRWGYDQADYRGYGAGFLDALRNSVRSGYPAILGIRGSGSSGHAVVCDGFRESDGRFHINYGWGGTCTAWYSLPSGVSAGCPYADYYTISSGILNIRAPNALPSTPGAPQPAHGATGVSASPVLSFDGGDPDGHPVAYDVFLSSERSLVSNLDPTSRVRTIAANTGTRQSFPLSSSLEPGTAYYWRVNAEDKFGGQQTGDVWEFTTGGCALDLAPTGRSFDHSGGTGTVDVTTSQPDCVWTAQVDVGWITITSGGSGPGSKTLSYTVAANPDGDRTGRITIAGKTHTVTQTGMNCTYQLAPVTRSFDVGGGTGTIDVTTSLPDCGWTAQVDVGWITITSGGSGPGSKTLSYAVAANAGAPRTGRITVEGQTHTVSQVGQGWSEDFEGDVSGWTASGLWHRTETKNHSPTHSFWFGNEQTGTYEQSRFRFALRSSGTLTSPQIPVSGGQQAMLSFWHWREVESYAAGARDVTSVWVRYGSGAWQEVWSLDSRTASQADWVASPEIVLDVPAGAPHLQLEFRFDSVNSVNNAFTGWFVDDVHVSQSSCSYDLAPTGRSFDHSGGTGTVDVTTPQPDCVWTAQVDVGWITITSGGSGPGSKTLSYTVAANPDGDRTGRITIAGKTHTVTQTGMNCTYQVAPVTRSFDVGGGTGTVDVTTSLPDCGWTAQVDVGWITITSGGSGPGSKTLSYAVAANAGAPRTGRITVEGQTHTVSQVGQGWSEDFEGDVSGWTASGLWHRTETKNHSPTHSFWFGNEQTGTYEQSRFRFALRSSGTLTSPQIPVSGGQQAMLSFWHWREVESYAAGARDVTSVWVRYGSGAWQEVWSLDSRTASQADWVASPEIVLDVPTGVPHLQLEFRFDSVNSVSNAFTGWFVDDVQVAETGNPTPQALHETTPLRGPPVVVAPNYVDGSTVVRFRADSSMGADELHVEVYDLGGRLVWQDVTHMSELTWHGEDRDGTRLASGVYLYRAVLRVGSEWLQPCVGKVFIIR
ncbi:BACON domain-containing protein [Candidatus Bipolaricaulota bacterium]